MPQKTSEVLGEAFELGGLAEVPFRVSLRCRAWSGVYLRDHLKLLESLPALRGGLKAEMLF